MTAEERKGGACMEILRTLPSKDWPFGTLLIYRSSCMYVKKDEAKYLRITKGCVIRSIDDALHSSDTFKQRVWRFNYLPPEFFD